MVINHKKKENEMKNLIMMIVVSVIAVTGNCWAKNNESEGVKIGFKELPIAIQQASMKFFDVNNIEEIEKHAEVDTSQYDIEGMSDGKKLDVIFALNGTVIQTSIKVGFSSLPQLAQQALRKDYPGMEIKEVEKVIETTYKVKILVNGKKREVEVKASGDIEDDNDIDGENDNDDDN